jgi:hypothetical protein
VHSCRVERNGARDHKQRCKSSHDVRPR